MSRTADVKHWDSSSDYHQLRAGHAQAQAQSVLIPTILEVNGKQRISSIVDFACGAGAIAHEVVQGTVANGLSINRFGLMDVNQDNLGPASALLKSLNTKIDIELMKANGSDFSDILNKKYDFLYCWDAMVHFDIIDVVGYIKTIANIIHGYALIHHSNIQMLTTDIRNNPHWRNFMGKDVFAQICLSCGHSIVWQREMDWGEKNLGCLTLIQVQ